MLLFSSKYDIICVSETWANSSIPDSLLLNGSLYSLIRCDRSADRAGGGACIFIKSSLKFKSIDIPFTPNVDIVCIDVLGFETKFRFINCYVPPRSSLMSESNLKCFVANIDSLFNTDASIIITGDFNLPGIVWSVNDLLAIDSTDGVYYSCFIDFIQTRGLLQHVTSPTRLDNILDLVLSNDSFAIFDLDVCAPFHLTNDHNSITFKVFSGVDLLSGSTNSNSKFNFNKADWNSILSTIHDIDWPHLLKNISVKNLWDCFHSTLLSVINKFVPKYKSVSGSRIHYPAHIMKLQSRKNILWKKWRTSKLDSDRLRYLDISKQCRQAIYEFTLKKESDLVDSSNPGGFYKYVNRKLSSRSGIGV